MTIEVYCPVNNEQKIMPYFMRHYSVFAGVILLENNCTDRTINIARSMGAIIKHINTPDEYREGLILELKNNCWKKSKADWVLIVDADEFIYHPDLVNMLRKTKATLFQPRFFNMFSNKFPTTEGQIYDEVKHGTDGGIWGNKINIFRPSEIEEINYSPGCHNAKPEGNIVCGFDLELKTLHMKYLSKRYAIARNIRAKRRLNVEDRKRGLCVQFDWSPEQTSKFIDEGIAKSTKII